MNIQADKTRTLAGMINEATRIVIVTHTHPDGDAIGSTTALRSYLVSGLGKDCRTAISDPYTENLSFILDEDDKSSMLCHSFDAEATESWISGCDLIFCLDCNGFSRTEALCSVLSGSSAKKVLIDHHLNPQEDQFDLCFSETEISSACEVLFNVLMTLPDVAGDAARLPMHALEALMTGMTTDTNNFANSVYPSTWQMVSVLMSAGVDRDAILEHLFSSYRENRFRLIGYLLSEKMTITSTGTAYTILTKEEQRRFDMKEGDLEGYVNMPLAIDKVRMSIFLKEDEGHFRVSIRSKKGTSANRCASTYFNGGGHEQASGGRLYFPQDIADISQAAEYTKRVTDIFFEQA